MNDFINLSDGGKIHQKYQARIASLKEFMKDKTLSTSMTEYDRAKVDTYRKFIVFCIENNLFTLIYILSTIRHVQKYKLRRV